MADSAPAPKEDEAPTVSTESSASPTPTTANVTDASSASRAKRYSDCLFIAIIVGAVLFFALTCVALYKYAAGGSSTGLSKATWDKAVDGKTVFVKFLAPW